MNNKSTINDSLFWKYFTTDTIFQQENLCETDSFGQRLDSLYIDDNVTKDRLNDVKKLQLECQALWEEELRKMQFLSDPRRAVDPATVGTIINISKMLLDLYRGKFNFVLLCHGLIPLDQIF